MLLRKKPLNRPIAYAVAFIGSALSFSAQALNNAEQAYFSSSYGYCDAKKIAHVWKTNTYQGKTIIGNKILANLTNLADQDISSTSRSVSCNWSETSLSYNDAEKLSRYWGRTVGAAKEKAAQMVSEMGTKRFREIMASALR